MKSIRKITLRLSVLFLIALLWACVKADNQAPPGPVVPGRGYLSLNMVYEEGKPTRAAGEMSGIPGEGAFNSVLFILYDAATGAAEIIDHYTLSDDGTVLTATDDTQNLVVATDEQGNMVIRKKTTGIEVKGYKLAVIVNSGVGGKNLNAISTGSGNTSFLGEVLRTGGHSSSLLSTPLELSQYSGGTAGIDKGIGLALTAMPLVFPSKADYATDASLSGQMRILMSNADGLAEIGTDNIYSSAAEAAANPVTLKVERSVCKVAVFRTLDPGNLSHGAVVEDFSWTCDIINTYTYLTRQQAATAPSVGGVFETPATDRRYRYASDPNFDGYSNDRGAAEELSRQFFRLGDLGSAGREGAFFKTWNTCSPDVQAEEWTSWEYVTENTMAAAEQWEDVTTRVVIKCNYVPGSGNSLSTIQAGDGYYVYNGMAMTTDQMKGFYENPASIPYAAYPLLEGLGEAVADPSVVSAMGWPDSFDSPVESRTAGGISFYFRGINYYRVLIRHFDDTLSPDMMGYGRYGVVRNNVYKIKIKDITGPGAITVPEPGGPDDKDDDIVTEIAVTPWETRKLVFDL